MKKSIYFRIGFDRSWIIEQKNSRPMPVDKFVDALGKRYELTQLRTRLTGCEAVINCDKDENTLSAELLSVIGSVFGLDDPNSVCFIECKEEESSEEKTGQEPAAEKPSEPVKSAGSEPSAPEVKAADEAPEESSESDGDKSAKSESEKQSGFSFLKKKGSDEAEKSKTAEDVLKEINSLIGANEFKMLADECVRIAPLLKQNDTVDSLTSRAYLISINEGCGLSTYLKLFMQLVAKLGLMEFKANSEPTEILLSEPGPNNQNNENAVKMLQNSGIPRVMCLDLSEYMSKLQSPQIREIFKAAGKAAGNHIIFFRIPFVEQNVINGIKEVLSDTMFVKTLSIPPFDPDELRRSAQKIISEKAFTMDETSWSVFDAKVAAEKSDGRFYGIETVKKIVRELLYQKQLYNLDNDVSDNLIKQEEITGLVGNYYSEKRDGFEQLSELIGMESISTKIKEIVAQIEASINNDSLQKPCIHMRFVGNPGTGKTTVARILGQIMKDKGVLRNGAFFEYGGRDLCGRFVGHTAPLTSSICRDAYGSVLFIDEAYSLYRPTAYEDNDYGREALDTLVAEMENHRSDLLVIMAGYPKEMEGLMQGNPGLRSRMPYQIEFPNYTKEQLAQIYLSMAKKNFTFDQDFENAVKLFFDNLSDEVINAKDFSNGRYVRNLFERTWAKAALRCSNNSIPCKDLTVEDFDLAAGDKDFSQKLEKEKKRTIGFN